jgi:hypothetical protein
MLPNNFSSQWNACEEKVRSFTPRVNEDGVPEGAHVYQPGKHSFILNIFLFIGKVLVSIILMPVHVAVHLKHFRLHPHPRSSGIH